MATEHKTILVGDSGVGKTAMAKFATSGEVLSRSQPTIGAGHFSYHASDVDLSIWDTAGQEQFRSLVPMYVRGAEVALLVFDLTSRASFQSIREWARLVRGQAMDCEFYVVGNKVDLEERREISDNEGRGVCDELSGAGFHTTSAVTGAGIADLFTAIVMRIRDRAAQAQRQDNSLRDTIDMDQSAKFSYCC
jgi:small GTP-binding protein